MPRFVVPAALLLAALLPAQTTFFPLKDVKPGMRGVGKTVFSGDRVEEFQVEVLGILDNIGPKQSLILARLSGGPLEHTGVMQGMSGSPVYIDGKLVGAVAMAFSYSKDPIAGIRPIEEMVSRAGAPAPPARRSVASLGDRDLLRDFPAPQPPLGDSRMVDIATPLSFGGFTRETLDEFAPKLRTLGLSPRQGVGTGADIAPGLGDTSKVTPGSMISVQLMAGDLSVGADGTVTHVEGNRVYAFGHKFLSVGTTALPFAHADVIALLPTLDTSSKLSTAKEWMGTVRLDADSGISGELGKLPTMAPVSISVSRAGQAIESYRMRMVVDPLLSPLLLQMAVSSVIQATERTVGASTVKLTGQMEFDNAPAPVRINDMLSLDTGSATQAALTAAIPLSYIMSSGFDALALKNISLNLDVANEKKQLSIDGVTLSRREVRPGQSVDLYVSLVGENGREETRQVRYDVPIGAEPGTLYFTIADATVTNLTDFRHVVAATVRSPGQLVSTVNNLHPSNKAYVRVWRANPSFQLEGAELPDPPTSVAMILGGRQSALGGVSQNRNAKIAQMEIDAGDMVVSGSKTVQVEIKE